MVFPYILVVTFCLQTIGSSAQENDCAPTWTNFNNSCYFINHDANIPWAQAMTECQERGSDLTSIHSVEEQAFLVDRILSVQGNNNAQYYIGFHDMDSEGEFKWTDGTQVDYTAWNPGEPNGGSGENCASLWKNRGGTWNDESCYSNNAYICKAKHGCADYTYASENFLQSSSLPVTSSECLDKQVITSKTVTRVESTRVKFSHDNRFDHRNRFIYRFDFDVSLLDSSATPAPDEYSIDFITPSNVEVLRVGDEASFTILISVIPNGESVSKLVLNTTGALNLYNNTLFFTIDPPLEVVPGSVDVSLTVHGFQWPEDIEMLNGDSHLFFMICIDGPNCGPFEDSWNNLTVEFNHLSCLDPYTDLFGAYQTTCVQTAQEKVTTTSSTTERISTRGSISTERALSTLPDSPVTIETSACEPGWMYNQTSCYQLQSIKSSWTIAETLCKFKFTAPSPITSHIAVINSEEEQNFLVSIVPVDEYFWIGCSDVVNEGVWVCEDSSGMFFNTDGSQLGYWNWNPQEPNGGTGENCPQCRHYGNDTGWNDNSCATPSYTICEYELQQVTTSTTEEIVKPRKTTSAPTVTTSTTEEIVKPRTTTSAPTALDEELGKLADVNVTTDNVLTVAKNLTVLADDNVEIDDDNLEDISNILDDIVAVKDPSLNVTESVVNTVDNIIESYVGETRVDNEDTSVPEAPNQIQRTLEQQISTLQTNPNIVNTTIQARNVAIQAVKVPKESVVNRRLVFETIPEGQNEILNTTVTTREAGEESEDEVEAAISFQLPIDILSNIDGNQSLAVSFFVYNDSTLFPSTLLANKSFREQDDVQRIVASRVISATLEGIEVKNLPEDNPVETLFALNKVNDYEGDIDEFNAIECVFWDITASNGLGDWSNDGCQHNRTLSDGRVVCHCNHLTSFAVLVDIHGKTSLVLDIASKVGCGISIACLLITLVTYLSTRRLRRVKPKKILISFCFSLLCLYVVFVIGIERGARPDAWCITVSALLHYFTLTSIAWMAVEAFHMYCSFVKVVGRLAHITRFLLKASLVAWGLPAVMVVIVLIADVNQYNNENYCFLKIGYAFYFTHLLVLALVVGVNTVIFGLVMHRLTCGRNTTSTTRNKQEERREALKRAQNAIAISSLMGLTWVFGLFSLIHEDSNLVFQFLFCICNSLQGALIFAMFCVRQPDVVAIWKGWISCGKTNENKGHKKMDVSQSSGFVSDTGRKTLSSDVATSQL